MLWTIFVILLVLWLLGMVSSYTLGGYIHLLLVVAVVVLAIVLAAAIIDEIVSSGVRSLPPQVGLVAPQPVGNGLFRYFPRSGRASSPSSSRPRRRGRSSVSWATTL